MTISWNDLNNVQEPGEYPFRDGTITVSFAEIAIWKRRPDALFQLMRKHPIQLRINYVLGKQIEPSPAKAEDEQIFYTSSNGDVWCLTRDPASGVDTVTHRPNARSGGKTSSISVDEFLKESPDGPQHQALRSLQEKQNHQGPG